MYLKSFIKKREKSMKYFRMRWHVGNVGILSENTYMYNLYDDVLYYVQYLGQFCSKQKILLLSFFNSIKVHIYFLKIGEMHLKE